MWIYQIRIPGNSKKSNQTSTKCVKNLIQAKGTAARMDLGWQVDATGCGYLKIPRGKKIQWKLKGLKLMYL